MFLLIRTDGSVEPLSDVTRIENEGNGLICLDGAGAIVRRYAPQQVLLYGEEAKMLPLLAEDRAATAKVQRVTADGSQAPCCAVGCDDTEAVTFMFDGARGGVKLGLCGAHECLIDVQGKTIALDELDLHRLVISEAEPPLTPV